MSDDESTVATVQTMREFREIADDVNEMIVDEESEEQNISTERDEDERMFEGIPAQTPEDTEEETHEPVPDNVVSQTNDDDDSQSDDGSTITVNSDNEDEDQLNQNSSEEEPEGRYNLRTRKNTDYRSLHRYRETQLMQLQKEWISNQLSPKVPTKYKDKKVVDMKTDDLFRRVAHATFTQMSKEDKYAQVSVAEGIR